MSTRTSNFDFIKTDLTDPADATIPNENWDKLDSLIPEYQKPWNVDGHIGAISPSESLQSIGDSQDTLIFGKEEKLDIYMKNSGDIYLTFSPYVMESNTNYRPTQCVLTLYLNGNVIKSFTYGSGGTDGSIDDLRFNKGSVTLTGKLDQKLLFRVEKGDIITVGIKNKCATVGYSASFYVEKIQLFANVETPYIYMGLTEGNDEITATDILNALTGGVE
jgi:hypothetical protein